MDTSIHHLGTSVKGVNLKVLCEIPQKPTVRLVLICYDEVIATGD